MNRATKRTSTLEPNLTTNTKGSSVYALNQRKPSTLTVGRKQDGDTIRKDLKMKILDNQMKNKPNLVNNSSAKRPVKSGNVQIGRKLSKLAVTLDKPKVLTVEERNKMEDMSEKVIKFIKTSSPFTERSLEKLLTQVLHQCLGERVVNTRATLLFVRATRDLLESLVKEMDDSDVTDWMTSEQHDVDMELQQSSSATLLCYRERYLKDLVMGLLQGFCGNEDFKEGSRFYTLSEASKERIREIRELLRTDPGISTDTLSQLEYRLEELKRSLCWNHLDLSIPKPAQGVLRACCVSSVDLEEFENEVCVPRTPMVAEENKTKTTIKENKLLPPKVSGKESLNCLVHSTQTVQDQMSHEKSDNVPEDSTVSLGDSSVSLINLEDEINEAETRMYLETLMAQRLRSAYVKKDSALEVISEEGEEELDILNTERSIEIFDGDDANALVRENSITYSETNAFQDCLLQKKSDGDSKDSLNEYYQASKLIGNRVAAEKDLQFDAQEVKVVYEKDTPPYLIYSFESLENIESDVTEVHARAIQDASVEQVATILSRLSKRMKELPSYLSDATLDISRKKSLTQLFNPFNTNSEIGEINELFLEKVSTIYFRLSEILNRTPNMREKPLSSLNPPLSMVDSLTRLQSTEFFKPCFVDVLKESYHKVSEKLDHQDEESNLMTVEGKISEEDFINNNNDFTTHDVVSVSSSKELTLQNVSEMFRSLSNVLVGIPVSEGSRKLSSLDPPKSLVSALNILFRADLPGTSNLTSFDSLTLQETIDLFLLLSSTLEEIPVRVKSSPLSCLNPPESFSRAVHLLAGLSSHGGSTTVESGTGEELESRCSQDFFDAVESLEQLKCA